METKSLDLRTLQSKLLWQMTGEELFALMRHAIAVETGGTDTVQKTVLLTGIKALAAYLDCGTTTVCALRKAGVLDNAVISQIGRRIVFDGEQARALANDYITNRRAK